MENIFARQLPQVERGVVIVDNAMPREVVERLESCTLLGAA